MDFQIPQQFQGIVDRAKALRRPMRVVLAGANAENILQGLFAAQEAGFAEPILVGKYRKTHEMLEALNLKDRPFDFQPIGTDTNPVQYAIEMINSGAADTLMRGNTQTRDFLMPILNKANHLIKEGRLVTDINMMKMDGYDRVLAVSDCTVMVEPSIEQREEVVRNLTEAMQLLYGIECPNIALLALVEKPSFHMRDTVEAQTIVLHHREEPIANCNLVGPISYDLIVSKEAARLKNFDCPYCGEFDGIVVPSLEMGNIICKVIGTHLTTTGLNALMGTTIPIAATGRSESAQKAFLTLAASAAMFEEKFK